MKEIDYKAIIERYNHQELNREKTINLLVFLIQSKDDAGVRLEIIDSLDQLNAFDEKLYKFIESLVISDADPLIREKAIEILKIYYLENAFKPVKWALEHEQNYNCLISLIHTLVRINTPSSKNLLLSILRKRLSENKKNIAPLGLRKYNHIIDHLCEKGIIQTFSLEHLANHLVGYITIGELLNTFYSVHYELDRTTYLPVKLDMSDIEFEVRGWKAEFRNAIEHLSEITGLLNLQSLRHLDLSNNRIKNIRELVGLNNLKYLYLSNNQIEDEINFTYLKKLKNLVYLDISGNKIAYCSSKIALHKDLEIKVQNLNYFQ
ncbi:MAG: hypothetical protein BAJALOKI3v1_1160001 [Promethearchaeota archaeon]|nr:MAG: hypothetical protein BAJALOKI3v1_1160001 [Candidatus Lokiarchaeota archaeon]